MPRLMLISAVLWCVPPMSAQTPHTRDSAGIQIVENTARAAAPTAFHLAEQPSYDVGGRKANRDDELNKISITALQQIRLSDGRYVITDLDRFRIFDSTGKQLRVVGRKGNAPGEFGSISTICRTRGDTIVVYDGTRRDVAVFEGSGQFVHEMSFTPLTYVPASGCFDDGTILLTETVRQAPARTVVTRRRLDGTMVDTIGVFLRPALGLFVTIHETYAAIGDEVYVGDARASEVRVYKSNGTLARIIRTADTTEATTPGERLSMVALSAPGTSDTAIMNRFYNRLHNDPRPGAWPAYGRIMANPNGGVWVEDYSKKPTGLPNVWTAFDASGKIVGKVTLPPWDRPGDPVLRSFTSDGVVVVRNGDDGMVHIYTYPLVPVKTGIP